jgi:hypothetical protein
VAREGQGEQGNDSVLGSPAAKHLAGIPRRLPHAPLVKPLPRGCRERAGLGRNETDFDGDPVARTSALLDETHDPREIAPLDEPPPSRVRIPLSARIGGFCLHVSIPSNTTTGLCTLSRRPQPRFGHPPPIRGLPHDELVHKPVFRTGRGWAVRPRATILSKPSTLGVKKERKIEGPGCSVRAVGAFAFRRHDR